MVRFPPMGTCDDCFALRHHRCNGRNGCECSICAAKIKKRRAAPKKVVPKATKPKKRPAKRAAPRSDSAKAAYMREYRRRKAAGEVVGDYRRTSEADIGRIIELRAEGLTYREIGAEMGMDYSYIARLYKRTMAERRAED